MRRLLQFLRGVELAVHAVDRIARDLHAIGQRLESLALMQSAELIYCADCAYPDRAIAAAEFRREMACQTLELSGIPRPS